MGKKGRWSSCSGIVSDAEGGDSTWPVSTEGEGRDSSKPVKSACNAVTSSSCLDR